MHKNKEFDKNKKCDFCENKALIGYNYCPSCGKKQLPTLQQ